MDIYHWLYTQLFWEAVIHRFLLEQTNPLKWENLLAVHASQDQRIQYWIFVYTWMYQNLWIKSRQSYDKLPVLNSPDALFILYH